MTEPRSESVEVRCMECGDTFESFDPTDRLIWFMNHWEDEHRRGK